MGKKPDLDDLLRLHPFGDGSYSSELSRILVDYVRKKTKLLRHTDRSLSFPVTKTLPWSRIQKYAADTRFQQFLLSRLNELASDDVTCTFRTYPASKKGVLGYLVLETQYDPKAVSLAELEFDKLVWPKF